MSKHFANGKRDAEHRIYRPPHEKGALRELVFGSYTKKEIEDRRDYSAGRQAGLKKRK